MAYTIKALDATTRDIRKTLYEGREKTFLNFGALKHELARSGSPWHYGAGFHVVDGDGEIVFTSADWRETELLTSGPKSKITLRELRDMYKEETE